MLVRLYTFKKLMQLLALMLYTAFVGVLLVYFKASIVLVMVVLSILPLIVLWWHARMRLGVIPIMLLVSLAGATLFEVSAYINGLWYETSPSEYRLFALIPVEAFVAAFVHVLYFILVYEYFFDDRKSSGTVKRRSVGLLVGGVMGMLALALAYVYLFSSVIISYGFAWLLLLGTIVVAGAVWLVHPKQVRRVLTKTALFATAVYPLSVVYEYVALSNNLRFFANTPEYLYSFTVLGQPLPLEELLFIWLVPFWVTTIYELYVDDGR